MREAVGNRKQSVNNKDGERLRERARGREESKGGARGYRLVWLHNPS